MRSRRDLLFGAAALMIGAALPQPVHRDLLPAADADLCEAVAADPVLREWFTEAVGAFTPDRDVRRAMLAHIFDGQPMPAAHRGEWSAFVAALVAGKEAWL